MTTVQRLGARLASPVLTATFFVLMAAGALAVMKLGWPATWSVLPPLALLCINLVASIFVHPRFRSDLPLLVFHLALLALIVLLAVARASYYEGRATLILETAFEGELLSEESGPLHRKRLSELRFANEGLVEDLATYGKYAATFNRVRWWGPDGAEYVTEIGDDRPLLLAGYRIYTTRNRGFAPIFSWTPKDGTVEIGGVQLRDMGQGGFTPDSGWLLPNGPEVWAMLEPVEAASLTSPRRVNLDAAALTHRLVVRVGETRHVLQRGETVVLPEGNLRYLELRSWMGYRISHDPTAPWLIAVVVTAIGALAFYYGRQFVGRRRGPVATSAPPVQPRPGG